MAILIPTRGDTSKITPVNKTDFTIKELRQALDCDTVEIVYLSDNYLLVVDDNGRYRSDAAVNERATTIYNDNTKAKEFFAEMDKKKAEGTLNNILYQSARETGFEPHHIVGPAVLCKTYEIR